MYVCLVLLQIRQFRTCFLHPVSDEAKGSAYHWLVKFSCILDVPRVCGRDSEARLWDVPRLARTDGDRLVRRTTVHHYALDTPLGGPRDLLPLQEATTLKWRGRCILRSGSVH